jgi:glucose-6-phosphate dehydrogenase assembly protein OpcA
MAQTLSAPGALDWTGHGVTIAQVLNALTEFRLRFARAQVADYDHPHPRNCVMTLIAVATNEVDEKLAQNLCTAIAVHHPMLAIVVREQADVKEGLIDASITAPPAVQLDESAAGTVVAPPHYELVTLHVKGAAATHLAGLVDPLLVSGVPTYIWWLGTPPFGSKELRDTLKIADALVVDSARFANPYHSFLGLADTIAHAHRKLGFADFQWARLDPWRESIAQFFAPVKRRAFLAGVNEIGVDYRGVGRGNRIPSSVLMGWIASALEWKLQRATGGSGGIVSAEFAAEDWRIVDVAFRSIVKPGLVEGEVAGVRINGASSGTTFRLSISRAPDRSWRPPPDIGPSEFRQLHAAGDDEAGLEIAHRRAAQHREITFQNRDSLHHIATGEAPGESVPKGSTVFVRERRNPDNSMVLLTLIDIGQADTLRHVQRIESNDDASLLVKLLAMGGRDPVFARSVAAGAQLMRAL